MIKDFVNAFSTGLQILIVVILAVGAGLGYLLIPDVLTFGAKAIGIHPLAKIIAGGVFAWMAEVILLGSAFVLLDMRNTILAIDEKVATLLQENKEKADLTTRPREVPDSIFFGSEILLTPTMEEVGIPRELGQLGVFQSNLKVGDWVNRGDELLTITYHFYSGTEKPRGWFDSDGTYNDVVTFHSPVSGLIVNFRNEYIAYYGMAMATSSGRSIAYGNKPVFPVILLPRDEPPQNHYGFFYDRLKHNLREWPRILFSHSDKGYIRMAELRDEFPPGEIKDVKVQKFETRKIVVDDEEILRNVQNLRERNLVLRDKLVHLVKNNSR